MIRGHMDAVILNILSQADSYGYEVSKTVKKLSENQYEINEATLYTVFRRLEKSGHIESYWGDESQGGRRKYYKITATGLEKLANARDSWQFAQKIITKLIMGTIENKGDDSWKIY
ncbi:PadR family transcriptional regulator [Lactococcus fujiensis]|nr:PadR family transcriptional regulator [Lactococcus fujiensis]